MLALLDRYDRKGHGQVRAEGVLVAPTAVDECRVKERDDRVLRSGEVVPVGESENGCLVVDVVKGLVWVIRV